VSKWQRWSTLTGSEQGSVDGSMTDVGGALSKFVFNFALLLNFHGKRHSIACSGRINCLFDDCCANYYCGDDCCGMIVVVMIVESFEMKMKREILKSKCI
jgi:hypothetical protein